jgi:spore coat polysaccharide biosynthesis protein SpsF
MPRRQPRSDAERLEQLWSGGFGDAYLDRNLDVGEGRDVFWNSILDDISPNRVLEVGCNAGPNLRWIAARCEHVYGVDINTRALHAARERLPAANLLFAEARSLPFRDAWFDLSFTAGVLIHQPPATLPLVMSEVVRVSRRFVLAIEYASDAVEEVPYRGERDALFKRDYGRLYGELFPELTLLRSGDLSPTDGWDDVTWWLLEKQ